MKILTTASVAIVTGWMMMSAASTSARAAMTGSGSINAEVASATDPSPVPNVEHSWLMPSAANQRHQSMTCKPGHLFSPHDVVGDRESCIMQGAGISGVSTAAAVPAL
jgi:hypothetical protein